MTTLREAVQEYLSMRRALGFKLQEIGKGLRDFVTFMEKHRASYITSTLALAWAQQPRNVQPAHWAQRLSYVRVFARHRSATDPRTLRQLLRIVREYPRQSVVSAVADAARYGLFDLDRLERMVLRHIAREYFLLDEWKKGSPDEDE